MATYTPTPDEMTDAKAAVPQAQHKRTVGQVTTAAGGGSAIGGALATLLVAIFGPDWDAATVAALATVLSAALAFLGGYLVPSRKGELQAQMADALVMTHAEKEELVESATQRAASLAIPNIPALVEQALDARLEEAQPLAQEDVADAEQVALVSDDAGAGLAKFSL